MLETAAEDAGAKRTLAPLRQWYYRIRQRL
jgi:hypothetical protein